MISSIEPSIDFDPSTFIILVSCVCVLLLILLRDYICVDKTVIDLRTEKYYLMRIIVIYYQESSVQAIPTDQSNQ